MRWFRRKRKPEPKATITFQERPGWYGPSPMRVIHLHSSGRHDRTASDHSAVVAHASVLAAASRLGVRRG